MHFGMGEVFQFSSPYKWRFSKLFYRLFVYCSWLLIARDNSTGFTIQWGVSGTDRDVVFPRAFSVVRACVAIENSGAFTMTTISNLRNDRVYLHGRNNACYVCVGFS